MGEAVFQAPAVVGSGEATPLMHCSAGAREPRQQAAGGGDGQRLRPGTEAGPGRVSGRPAAVPRQSPFFTTQPPPSTTFRGTRSGLTSKSLEIRFAVVIRGKILLWWGWVFGLLGHFESFLLLLLLCGPRVTCSLSLLGGVFELWRDTGVGRG